MSMNRLRSKRPLLLLWAFSWLFCAVSLDILHNLNDGVTETAAHHHACVVCQYGSQSAPAVSAPLAMLPIVRVYTAVAFSDTGAVFVAPICPRSVAPRGPPFPFVVAA